MIHIIEVASIATPASRISGDATLVKDGDFPFMVSVTLNDAHICGGFIYNSRFIVTAASCVYQYNGFLNYKRLTFSIFARSALTILGKLLLKFK